ncbi:alkene reductase [Devosia rhizoryzae]|uniref:Alkene reductase n=1 Tax=Devosia rhizoryzae TaxID=2774137 RepID=A0ABX7C2M6_9HYPH|nr:alkene reductase [Devosia rhizoryzae]QQR38494.1 alkene reductase [Devosia rhizoryzae]
MIAPLLTSFSIGALNFPNRVVMAPMTRRRAAYGKLPTALMAQYYAQRASAGLIISESIEVDPLSGLQGPTRPGLFNEKQRDAWLLVTRAVHEAGGRIFAQLSHMGRAAHASQLEPGGRVIAPSAIAASGQIYTAKGPVPYETPAELDTTDIATLVQQYALAAALAQEAEFDGVELHGANGYLIDQFLRDASNQRIDHYGGSAANRARFLLEIFDAVSQVWPRSQIGVRVSPTNTFQGMGDSDPVAHFTAIAQLLSARAPAYLHVVEPPVQPEGVPYVAGAIRANFTGPLILAGKFGLATGNAAIETGRADLVAFGESFLANPDLPQRFLSGAALNEPDKATFYTSGEAGYTDYPFAQG